MKIIKTNVSYNGLKATQEACTGNRMHRTKEYPAFIKTGTSHSGINSRAQDKQQVSPRQDWVSPESPEYGSVSVMFPANKRMKECECEWNRH